MSEEAKIAEIERRRADRKAKQQALCDAQYAIDLEAVDALEVEHGEGSVAVLRVPYTEGLPVLIVVRKPTSAELKRYRARLKEKRPDMVAAAEELADVVRLYPDADHYSLLRENRPGVHSQLGVESLKLSVAATEEEGKG